MGKYTRNLLDLVDMDSPAIKELFSEPPLSHEEKLAQIERHRQISEMRKQQAQNVEPNTHYLTDQILEEIEEESSQLPSLTPEEGEKQIELFRQVISKATNNLEND